MTRTLFYEEEPMQEPDEASGAVAAPGACFWDSSMEKAMCMLPSSEGISIDGPVCGPNGVLPWGFHDQGVSCTC